MTPCRFLVDECVSALLVHGIRKHEPTIEVHQVGERGFPFKRTRDSELLLYCEQQRLALLSTDYTTLPEHVEEHNRQGHHTFGVFLLRPLVTFEEILDELRLIHGASWAEEWVDCLRYLPYYTCLS